MTIYKRVMMNNLQNRIVGKSSSLRDVHGPITPNIDMSSNYVAFGINSDGLTPKRGKKNCPSGNEEQNKFMFEQLDDHGLFLKNCKLVAYPACGGVELNFIPPRGGFS